MRTGVVTHSKCMVFSLDSTPDTLLHLLRKEINPLSATKNYIVIESITAAGDVSGYRLLTLY